MKIIIVGNNKKDIEPELDQMGFEIVKQDPDFVVSYGGDGTLIKAEEKFPGIPKIILKSSRICKLCSALPNEEILKNIKGGNYRVENIIKINAESGGHLSEPNSSADGKKLTAINDIIVHNADPRHAIRYALWVNEKIINEEIIGDGVVVATPFGSTGYYRSITDSFFEIGIGLAFNNSTEQADHMVLKENGEIKIKITRGPAIVYADNQDDFIKVKEGEEIKIQKSKETAKILKII